MNPMDNPEFYYRLMIRFTNGETLKFVTREPVDASDISDRTRFAIVRVHHHESPENAQLFIANFSDISYVKSERLDPKDIRHRVAGITGSLGSDDAAAPEDVATVQFI